MTKRRTIKLVDMESYKLNVNFQQPDPYTNKHVVEFEAHSYNERTNKWEQHPVVTKFFLTTEQLDSLGREMLRTASDQRLSDAPLLRLIP